MRRTVLLALAALLLTSASAVADEYGAIATIPVLDNGRVKPLDTVARESVRLVTGRESFGNVIENENGIQSIPQPRDAMTTFLDWQARQDESEMRPVLYVPDLELRKKMGMSEGQQWLAPLACRVTWFKTWQADLLGRRIKAQSTGEDPAFTRLETQAQELQRELDVYDSVTSGDILAILPVSDHNDRWFSIRELRSLQGADAESVAPLLQSWDGLLEAFAQGDQANVRDQAAKVSAELSQLAGPDYHKYDAAMEREVFYNSARPFLICAGVYFLAFITALLSTMWRRRFLEVAATLFFAAGIVLHGASIALRCSITGWAPVTNMYDTVIWVALTGAIFGLILHLVYAQRILIIGGSLVAIVGTIVADIMPPELGAAIRNLTPVLRSNLWLTIHVLTIVSSYAAFALALVLGNIVLGQFMFKRQDRAAISRNLVFVYRSVQIGVLLVAAGTILGGLWADVSWGRFWGWDPKEVWALIVLLVYLALLHGRFSGWIGRFGLAAGSVICFTAVLMSWYGVNFVLGVGLHSYGFGTGGRAYIATYVLLQWAFVALAWIRYRRNAASHAQVQMDAAVAPS